MIAFLGLVIVVAVVMVGAADVLNNGSHAHAVTHFTAFGYRVTGSTGTLFLYGIAAPALAMAGPSVLLAAAVATPAAGWRSPAARPRSSAKTSTTCAASTTPPAAVPPACWATTAPPGTAAIRACADPACSRAGPVPRRPARSQRRRPARLPPVPPSPVPPANLQVLFLPLPPARLRDDLDRQLTGSGAGPARELATACASRSHFAKEVTL
jgi:hypothetical protein